MSKAVIDVGSNSIRMLLQKTERNAEPTRQYYRQVTRLAGDFSPETGLAQQSMARTMAALQMFADLTKQHNVFEVTAVGTAVLRNAKNSREFIAIIKKQTGLDVSIISGKTEALLSCRGILSVLSPAPERAILFDIGGGSTEIILMDNSEIIYQISLPLGVVRLLEQYPGSDNYYAAIHTALEPLINNKSCQRWQKEKQPIELIGTAGTVTTLAAINLKMDDYDGSLVNNLILEKSWLYKLSHLLTGMSLRKRAEIPGMEAGRADVILPGLQIVCSLLEIAQCNDLRVANAGLLEGLFLNEGQTTFI